jgi:hypothetical protein
VHDTGVVLTAGEHERLAATGVRPGLRDGDLTVGADVEPAARLELPGPGDAIVDRRVEDDWALTLTQGQPFKLDS